MTQQQDMTQHNVQTLRNRLSEVENRMQNAASKAALLAARNELNLLLMGFALRQLDVTASDSETQ